MRQRVTYLYMEIKKTIRMFPGMLLQAALLMFLMGVAAFVGAKRMDKEPLAVSADIGIVVREDNTMTQMALKYVENLESVSEICRFVQLSEEEGFTALEQREIAALIVLPEQLVEGIMNGANPSVDIYFPQNAGLEAMLLRELTESGAELLRVAQAQIYGAYDTAKEYGLTDRLAVMEAEIDSYNLAFALDRLAVYDAETVSATGRLSVMQFYAASGAVLFLLFAGMAVYPVMQQEPQAFCRHLERQGTGQVWQGFCRWLCGFLCIGLLGGFPLVIFKFAGVIVPETMGRLSEALIGRRNRCPAGMQALVVLLILITAATWIYLLYSLAGSRIGGILLIFLCTVVMVYLSGGLVPAIFMPQTMQALGDKLPTAYLIRAVGGMLAGYGDGALGQCVMGMCIYTIVFGVAASFFRKRNWK